MPATVNDRGIALIKEFEGRRLTAYLDELAKPPVWTIGYGHTGALATEGRVIDQRTAEHLLRTDVAGFARSVARRCAIEPTENQFAAMVSLAFNIGVGNFERSTVLRMHNAGRFPEAAAAFSMWNKAGGRVRAGLTRRRAAEAALYLEPVDGSSQTTRAEPEAKDPAVRHDFGKIAAGSGVVLAAAQQSVAQVSSIWDGLAGLGVSPNLLLAVLGVASVAALLWFVLDARRRRAEGDL